MTKGKANVGGFGLNLSALAKGGSLFTFDLAEGAAVVLEVFEKIGEVIKEVVEHVVELGIEMLKTAAKTQDLNLAVKLDVGEKGVAGIEKLTEGFESTSRFDANDIKAAMLPLLEQGVTTRARSTTWRLPRRTSPRAATAAWPKCRARSRRSRRSR
jgi:hypothetical protein